MTIDKLIENLEYMRTNLGNTTIYIKDPDTGYHMEVIGVRESNNEPGKPLIVIEDYADYFTRGKS